MDNGYTAACAAGYGGGFEECGEVFWKAEGSEFLGDPTFQKSVLVTVTKAPSAPPPRI